jgi:Group II intron, maturase-specific domain
VARRIVDVLWLVKLWLKAPVERRNGDGKRRMSGKTKVSNLLTTGNKSAWPKVRTRLNRLLGGWAAYFSHGALASAYRAVNEHVCDRVREFLRERHKALGRGTKRFSREHVYEELGVPRLYACVTCRRRVLYDEARWWSQSESRMRENRTSGLMSGLRLESVLNSVAWDGGRGKA